MLFVAALCPSAFAEALDWTGHPGAVSFGPLDARAAVLLDAATGSVLYAQNGDERLPPASLVKIIVVNELLNEVKAGRLSLDQDVPIPTAAWARNAPPHSSLMFLGPGQRASLADILAGLAVPSGNDAAVAAALLLEPTVEAFLARVNGKLAAGGYGATRLADASGYSDDNVTTAMEYARFSRGYLLAHPEAVRLFHSLREFSYPRPENMLGSHRENTITQKSYNLLLSIMPEADGLKTGTTPAAGFNLAATAERGGRRLVAVILGARGDDRMSGHEKRAVLARDLLEYGFTAFTLVKPELPAPGEALLYGSGKRSLPLFLDADWAQGVAVPAAPVGELSVRLIAERRLWGAVPAGTVLGRAELVLGGRVISSAPLKAAEGATRGGALRRFWDWIRILFERMAGKEKPKTIEQLDI